VTAQISIFIDAIVFQHQKLGQSEVKVGLASAPDGVRQLPSFRACLRDSRDTINGAASVYTGLEPISHMVCV